VEAGVSYLGSHRGESTSWPHRVDGWFRAGDEGLLSRDGLLTLTGTIKEFIIATANRGGKKHLGARSGRSAARTSGCGASGGFRGTASVAGRRSGVRKAGCHVDERRLLDAVRQRRIPPQDPAALRGGGPDSHRSNWKDRTSWDGGVARIALGCLRGRRRPRACPTTGGLKQNGQITPKPLAHARGSPT